jgi:AcrR family transcriptional regulator
MAKPKSDKRQHIIESAARTFSKTGFARCTVSEIAKDADIGKGTVYEYFSSKEDLFFAVFEWVITQSWHSASASASLHDKSCIEKLRDLSDSQFDYWEEHKDMYVLVLEFWAASGATKTGDRFREAFKEINRMYRSIIKEMIHEGIEKREFRSDIDADAIAASLLGSFDSLLIQTWFDDAIDPKTAARKMLDSLFYGIKG